MQWTKEMLQAYNEYEKVGPLWLRVEDAWGKDEPEKTGLHRAASNWLTLHEIIRTHPRRAEFDATLTISQKKSWQLLIDWWEGRYQAQDLSEAAQAYIRAKAAQPAPTPEQPRKTDPYPETNKSFYHSSMFLLFELEFAPSAIDFDPRHGEPDEGYITLSDFYECLRHARELAATHAASQRIGFSCLNKSHISTSTSISQKPLSGTLQACSWLVPATGTTGMPYYLWDITRKITIITKDMDDSPAYTCISHTWGRWRVPDTSVGLEGVPWPVPVNTRFDVAALPDIFADQLWQTSYIWFDLFCIPQDDSELKDIEIARQAEIFRNSEACIAWLNDVEGWEAVSASVVWLGLTYLQSTSAPDIYEIDASLERYFSLSDINIEFFNYGAQQVLRIEDSRFGRFSQGLRKVLRKGRVSAGLDQGLAYCGWFSSLWTLQEACLCPNMTLASRHWDLLVDNDGNAISLDAIFQLEANTRRYAEYSKISGPPFSDPHAYTSSRQMQSTIQGTKTNIIGWPLGPQQLNKLANQTKMDALWAASPIDVLVLGNLRQCSDSRAQAIMSVLGATDWFTQCLGQTRPLPSEGNLILGMYPLEFVQEVAQKFGGSFFSSIKSSPTRLRLLRAALTGQSLGSMLPFSIPKFRPSITTMGSSNGNMEDHPAVTTWSVLPGGSVKTDFVGIVASSQETSSSGIQAWTIVTHGQKSSFVHAELRDTLRRLSKTYLWYAVALSRDSVMLSGIIFQSARLKLQSKRYMIKVGYFHTLQREFPISQHVNWLVL
jgi:hypothetical protein